MGKMWNAKGVGAVVVAVLFLQILCSESLITFHEKLAGKVGAGNYSYYSLSQNGEVIIFLHSIEGDADLYISDQSVQPTYDIMNHKLQSVTCGLDRVDVSSSFSRPINIGVYGHPSHEISHFVLEVLVDDAIANPVPSSQFATWKDDVAGNPVPSSPHARPSESGEETSLICRILLVILEIVVETFLG